MRQGTQIRREVALIGTSKTRVPKEQLEPETHEPSAYTQESSIWTYETFGHMKHLCTTSSSSFTMRTLPSSKS